MAIVARAYIRLSKFKQGEEKLSPDVQLDAVRGLCKLRGWELDEESSTANQDLDVSGFSVPWEKRDGLVKHYQDAKKGLFQRLIVFKADRLGRNVGDTIQCWDSFEKLGVDLFSVSDGIDTSTPSGLLMRNILLSVAEQESRNASVRITANVTARAHAGRRHGGRLPSWIEKGDDGQMIVNHGVAEGIIKAVEIRLDGKSYIKIVRTLNELGYRTASGSPFQKSYIVKLLQRRDWIETMMGHGYTRRSGRWKTDPRTQRRESRGTPIKVPNIYPAIISDEIGNKLITLIDESKMVNGVWKEDYHPSNPRQTNSDRWILNGHLHCAVCGSRLGVHVRKLDNRDRRTYFCEAHRDNPTAVEHSKSMVDADILELAVIASIEWFVRKLEKDKKTKPSTPVKRTRTTQDIDKEIARLFILFAKGKYSEEILDGLVKNLEQEREGILRSLEIPSDLEMKVTRAELKKLLKDLYVKVEYPVFIEGVVNPVNYRTKIATPRPCAKVSVSPCGPDPEMTEQIIVPLHRFEYTGHHLGYTMSVPSHPNGGGRVNKPHRLKVSDLVRSLVPRIG